MKNGESPANRLYLLCPGTYEDANSFSVDDDGAVVWLGKLAVDQGHSFGIVRGVGTRLGVVGRVFGGLSGIGINDRAMDLLAHVEIARPDQIFVAGFSRGCVAAYLTCRELDRLGVDVASVVVLDTVSQRWIPNFGSDGLEERFPANARAVHHAMSMHEPRWHFPLTRWENAMEVWFPGVHGEVGGRESVYPNVRASVAWAAHRLQLDCPYEDPAKHVTPVVPASMHKHRRKKLLQGDVKGPSFARKP